MKKYFSAENVFSKFFFTLLSFYKNSGFFLGFFLGQTQYAHDFPKLSLILCLENMLKFLGPFKKYVPSDGEGERGYSTNVRKRTRGGNLPRVHVSLYFLKGVFSHLNCSIFFVFHFFNGKVKTLTAWKVALYIIAAHLTSWRYQDIDFWKGNVQMQFDYNFFQLKKISQKNQIWTLFKQNPSLKLNCNLWRYSYTKSFVLYI